MWEMSNVEEESGVEWEREKRGRTFASFQNKRDTFPPFILHPGDRGTECHTYAILRDVLLVPETRFAAVSGGAVLAYDGIFVREGWHPLQHTDFFVAEVRGGEGTRALHC